MKSTSKFDVIIIGGSYAGLSAAMSLGRSLRKVLIIDSGLPCNRFTPHSHNFITHDGAKPSEIFYAAKEQVIKYPTIQFIEDKALKAMGVNLDFTVETAQGDIFNGKKLILTTGVKDVMPDIKGFSACWGISVIHCPYCHGYEFRGQRTGIFANGNKAFHMAQLVNNLTGDLRIFTNGKADFTAEQLQKLDHHGIEIITSELEEITHQNGQISAVQLKDSSSISLDALYAALPFIQHSDIAEKLGCHFTEAGHLKVDDFKKTNLPGVFAAGDNSFGMRSVSAAVNAGNMAGAMVNMELVHDTF